jgi:UDP-N-acetylmuramoyl-L-alanyl-D-glutamate--2,6-diaminopimelate ligase
MLLSKLIRSNEDIIRYGADADIRGLTADSRKVEPGFLFIAIPGTAHDGRAFIEEAIKRGAVAVLAPDGTAQPANASLLMAPDVRIAVGLIASRFYPRQPETIAAVTGTSGKTSTAQFTREIWQHLGYASASIGTLGLVTATESSYGSLTTPDAITLHHLLDECASKGISHLAMEASSHGLFMHRLDQVHVKAGGFTNLSRDHLDFHETLENYLAAKMRLFADVLPHGGAAVLNADISEFEKLKQAAESRGLKLITYGHAAKELHLVESVPDSRGQVLHVSLFGKEHKILLPAIGAFQAWNALCALGLAVGCGADVAKAAVALEHVSGVPGRLQKIGTSAKGATVFIDYAHKPDAMDNVLRALRPHVAAHKSAKLGVIFGCGGNRDKGKRPLMGGIAQRLADWVIITDDNPRHEEPATIRQEVLAGFTANGPQPTEIGDRAKAIAEGIDRLQPNDVLIIAGKGHEPGQIVGDTVLPFDDADVARKVLGL